MLNNIKEWLKNNVDEERYYHLLGSEIAAKELAERFGVDANRAALAALVHDCAKSLPYEELIKIINENNIVVSEMEIKSRKPLHAPVSSFLAQSKFGIQDQEILDSIRYHTIGRVNMSLFEKVVFLADKIEINTRDKEFRKRIYNVLDATNNIDEALLICYEITIKSLLDRRFFIDPETIKVWNDFIVNIYK
ncbi:MAG: bis(5'-nucleosyl)-tetraphosphatase (symmetrical) YqeK [Candidatus Gastranaerophilales bacterium]|nr:bis(5'-nucleosyl)-tetraphosphatase (symmetrical) YqeK [Candidatus Gastranaerophilales bacterium]